MANNELHKTYLFIDESGDPTFYGNRKKLLVGTEGFQPYLIIGMIETSDRKALRKAVVSFMESIKADSLYNTIPSVATDKGWYVHARGDHPEIRAKFFELLRNLDGYKAHIVIARKDLNIFTRKHNTNQTEFYFDVLHHLLNGRLTDTNCQYNLYLSQRGKNSLQRFQKAVDKALLATGSKTKESIKYNLEIVPSKDMPELSIIDYLMWAVQRSLLQGESCYFDALRSIYETVLNLYEEE
ncbi:DUF3800 domain-containing protein [Parasediminibacterium sp. JCM 36343]|uniref:DUF3800 domain-containing protein n=1 Tax=Parasediminibacterium sp. JCM 36343 TaxID=3374279 RepID=UPI00397A9AEB